MGSITGNRCSIHARAICGTVAPCFSRIGPRTASNRTPPGPYGDGAAHRTARGLMPSAAQRAFAGVVGSAGAAARPEVDLAEVAVHVGQIGGRGASPVQDEVVDRLGHVLEDAVRAR